MLLLQPTHGTRQGGPNIRMTPVGDLYLPTVIFDCLSTYITTLGLPLIIATIAAVTGVHLVNSSPERVNSRDASTSNAAHEGNDAESDTDMDSVTVQATMLREFGVQTSRSSSRSCSPLASPPRLRSASRSRSPSVPPPSLRSVSRWRSPSASPPRSRYASQSRSPPTLPPRPQSAPSSRPHPATLRSRSLSSSPHVLPSCSRSVMSSTFRSLSVLPPTSYHPRVERPECKTRPTPVRLADFCTVSTAAEPKWLRDAQSHLALLEQASSVHASTAASASSAGSLPVLPSLWLCCLSCCTADGCALAHALSAVGAARLH